MSGIKQITLYSIHYTLQTCIIYNNLCSILSTDKQDTKKKLDILKKNENINPYYHSCYQDFTFKNKYTYHYYATRLLEYTGLSINNIDNFEEGLERHDLEINLFKDIDGKDVFKFMGFIISCSEADVETGSSEILSSSL